MSGRLAWALATVMAAASACTETPPALTVARIVLDAPREYDAAPLERAVLRKSIEQRLGEDDSATVLAHNDRDATYVLSVRVGETVRVVPAGAASGADDGGPARAAEPGFAAQDQGGERAMESGAGTEPVLPAPAAPGQPMRLVQVKLRPLRDGPEYEAVGSANGEDRVATAMQAFDDAWRLLNRQRILDVKDDAALIAVLGDPDPRLRDFAIVRLGDRKSAAAVEALCKRLEAEPRPDLMLRAVGSLVAIGDSRAVDPIIALSERKNPDFVIQIVFAVGAIGGRTAEAFLVTMASGHPVEAVRKSAEQALSEMQRKSGRKARER